MKFKIGDTIRATGNQNLRKLVFTEGGGLVLELREANTFSFIKIGKTIVGYTPEYFSKLGDWELDEESVVDKILTKYNSAL